MRIISTTLTNNQESLIRDALLSVVDWVDTCLVIDTGVSDRSLDIAREVAGDKLAVTPFKWSDDFSAARNFALDYATHTLDGDWAITVDTDERICLRGEDIRATLESQDEAGGARTFSMFDRDRSYTKPRAFRLPAESRYVGPTHEAFASGRDGTFQQARFWEVPKTLEQANRKFERDIGILERYSSEHPGDARWKFYLGESHKNLGQLEPAIAAYDACANLWGWDEESAWACFRAAECCVLLARYREAIGFCCKGLERHSGVAELAWLAGFSAFKLGQFEKAIYWSRMASTNGKYEGTSHFTRRGFHFPPALYELPHEVMAFAYRRLGLRKAEALAQLDETAAKKQRLEATSLESPTSGETVVLEFGKS